jgi:hypothetical protein
MGGGIAGFAVTFAIIAFFTGISFAAQGGIQGIGWERMVSALAICMISSMLIIKVVKYKISGQYL